MKKIMLTDIFSSGSFLFKKLVGKMEIGNKTDIYYNSKILNFIGDKTGYAGITLFKKIFLFDNIKDFTKLDNRTEWLIYHELIHVEQQTKLGFLKFIYQYVKEYFKNRRQGMSKDQAYLNISFEKEAYDRTSKFINGVGCV